MLPPKKLPDQVHNQLRVKNYSFRTEKSYLDWIKQYILFHNKFHPNKMGCSEQQFHRLVLDNASCICERRTGARP